MKRLLKNIAVFTLVFLLAFGTSIDALAVPNSSGIEDGNDPVAPDDEEYVQVKIDPPVIGETTYYYNGYEITVIVSDDGLYLESWSTNAPVAYVYMKGGNGGDFYGFNGDTSYSGDPGLFCPDNGGGNTPAISHITFYFGEEEEEPDDEVEIRVEKIVDYDGPLDISDLKFVFNEGEDDEFELGDGESETFTDVGPDDFTFTETVPEGFSVMVRVSNSEDDSEDWGPWQDLDSVTVGETGDDDEDDDDDEFIIVQFKNIFNPGTLTVEKVIDDPDGIIDADAEFQFDVTGFDPAVYSQLLGDGDDYDYGDAFGDYMIKETYNGNQAPDSVEIVVTINGVAGDPTIISNSSELSEVGEAITVGEDDDVVVTFTNIYDPLPPGSSQLIVKKLIVNNTDFDLPDLGDGFEFTEEGEGQFFLLHDETEEFINEGSHLYGVKEVLMDDFDTTYQIDSGDVLDHDGEYVAVSVGEDESKTITFVNTYNPPILIVEKVIENPNDLTLPVEEFDFTVTGFDGFTLGDSGEWTAVVPEDTPLSIAETPVKDFTTMVYVDEDTTGMSLVEFLAEEPISVGHGESRRVTFVNTYDPGKLVIQKIVDGETPVDTFEFDITGPDDSIYDGMRVSVTDPSPYFEAFVPSGDYTIQEILQSNFDVEFSVDNGDFVSGSEATVTVVPGETKVVVYRNTYLPPEDGRIIVKKYVENALGDESFEFEIAMIDDQGDLIVTDGNPWTNTLGHGDTWTKDVESGKYRVSEETLLNYSATIMVDGTPVTPTGDGYIEFYVDETQTVLVEFTNTATSLKIVKIVEDGDETKTFEFTLNGALESDEQAYNDLLLELGNSLGWHEAVEAGTYTIQESVDGEYVTEIKIGDGAYSESTDGLIQVVVDQDTAVVVTYLNTWIDPGLGSLTIRKVVQDTSRNDTFTFRVVNEDVEYDETHTISGDGTKTITGLEPGTYVVSEISIPSNYDLITANNISVTVVENEVELVSFTNDYDSPPRNDPDPTRLRIEKTVVNNPDAGDFTFILNGPDYDNEEITLGDGDRWSRSVNDGTYTITEGLEDNYTLVVEVDGDVVSQSPEGTVRVDVDDETTVTVEFINTFEEEEEEEETTTIIQDVTPQGVPDPVPPEEPVIILEDIVPLGIDTLPQTGEASPEIFYGFGGLLAGLGYALRKFFK